MLIIYLEMLVYVSIYVLIGIYTDISIQFCPDNTRYNFGDFWQLHAQVQSVSPYFLIITSFDTIQFIAIN